MDHHYVLVTAAKNEAAHIAKTITSIIKQRLKPVAWIIVDDGSTDNTKAIVESYLGDNSFIRLLSMPVSYRRDFASKVHAINVALKCIDVTSYDFIGTIDADVSFGQAFIENISQAFSRDQSLGITGGVIWEMLKGKWKYVHSNPEWCVGGAAQFFRKQCFVDIGGYSLLPRGGEDTICEYVARSKGWRVYALNECQVFHHRSSLVQKKNVLRYVYELGKQDFSWGSGVVFEIMKCFSRIWRYPFFFGSIARLLGYLHCLIQKEPLDVSPEIAQLVRLQQKNRIHLAIKKLLGHGPQKD
jgi:poly-beta-1,6-N-acetyl-D-glucosamine synthase